MPTSTNAPKGANAPALSIAWHKLSEMWSATSAERAFIGPYELIAFDIPPAGPHARIIAWELHTGPTFTTGIAGAPADSFEAAKAAAEQEARRLLIATEVSTLIPALGMTFTEADAKATDLFAEAEAIYATRIEAEEDAADALVVEACDIRRAMFATPPRTPADALAVLNWLAHPEYGLRNPGHGCIEGQDKALGLLRDFMAALVDKGLRTAEAPGVGEPAKGVALADTLGAGVGNADAIPITAAPDPDLDPALSHAPSLGCASWPAPNLGVAPPQTPYPPK